MVAAPAGDSDSVLALYEQPSPSSLPEKSPVPLLTLEMEESPVPSPTLEMEEKPPVPSPT